MIKLIGHIKHFLNKNKRDNISALSGQSAFYIILSFVPFLMFIFALLAIIFGDKNMYDEALNSSLTKTGLSWLQRLISDTIERSAGVAVSTVIVALWSAGKAMYSVTDGIRRIYRLPDRHFWVIKRIIAMGYTLALFLVIFLLAVGTLVWGFLDDYIRPFIESLPCSSVIIYILTYSVVFVLVTIVLTLALKLFLRKKVEDKRFAGFRALLPGMAPVSLAWLLFSQGVVIYTRIFGTSSIYGSLGTVVIVMIWIYFMMYIFLCGVQFNYIYRRPICDFVFKDKKKND
ncbi:MAG: YihY/virulence factor BrkB family protein [Ruminococcus sp.]|nr:YihY/virulence factor BrkB family protein [Ruminococcus sp.]